MQLEVAAAEQTEVEAYTVEEARRILQPTSASPLASKVVPVIALGMFAGLRPELQNVEGEAGDGGTASPRAPIILVGEWVMIQGQLWIRCPSGRKRL